MPSRENRLLRRELSPGEEGYRDLMECLPDAVIVHVEGRIVYANACAVRMHGAKLADELLGRPISDFIRPENLDSIQEQIKRCHATGQASVPAEAMLVACDGALVDIEAAAVPISWQGVPAIEVVLRDIRQRKSAQQTAFTEQKRLELAQKAGLRIGLWDWDVAANAVKWSEETYRQFGFTREEFSGRVEDAIDRIHAKDRERVGAAIHKVLTGQAEEYSAKYRIVRPDGSICWIDAHGVMVRNGSAHMIGIGVDITDLMQTEQSLREGEEKYRKLFENATYGVFLARPDGTLLDVNRAMVKMLGYSSKEELLARNLDREIYENAADRQRIIANTRPEKRVEGAEVNWVRKDGKSFPVRLSGAAFYPEDGEIHFEVVVEDVTERRRLEEQYRQSQKLEAVGLLAGGISHDFNNLLGVILGNADLLAQKLPLSPEHHYLEAIKKAGCSAAQLIRQLLAFSRKQVLFPTILDVNAVVSDVGKILHRLIGEDVRIVTDLDRGIGAVRADRGQIEQILMNLATNARDAMPNGGTFTIRTGNSDLGPDDVMRYPYVVPGPYVQLAITDTGVGMSEEVRTRAFEPFFTTKEKGRGTGLGLATVYGIVKQSGGYIWVSSKPGEGTTFSIYFPRLAEKPVPEVSVNQQRTEYPRGTETVLVLEDDEALRQVTSEFLTASGYNVLHAGRPDHAIELAKHYKDDIALIVSDVVLPEMSGPAAFGRLRVVHPEIRVLFVSGFTEVPVAQQLVAEGATLLQKPFTRMQLLTRVREVLQAKQKR